MPDGFPDPNKIPDDQKRNFLQGLLANPNLLPESFLGYMVDYLAINQPSIPITLIQGFAQTVPTHDEVSTLQTTTSTTYANLSTTGPEITDLGPGEYFFQYGAATTIFSGGADRTCYVSIDINGAGAADADAAQFEQEQNTTTGNGTSIVRGVIKTLTAETNTVTLKYRTEAGTARFSNRWLIAIRLGNA